MAGHAIIYARREISLPGLRAAARALRLTPGAGDCLAVVQGAGVSLVISELRDAARDAHVAELRAYLADRCRVTDDTLVTALEDCAQVLHVSVEPDLQIAGPAAELVAALIRLGGGHGFDGERLRDSFGQVVAQPAPPPVVRLESGPIRAATGGGDTGRYGAPPAVTRVLRRAWASSAVAVRALLDDEPQDDAEALLARGWQWLEDHDAVGELEESEEAILATPHGELTSAQLLAAIRQGEGLPVLAWALGLVPLPDHEASCDAAALASQLGFLARTLPPAIAEPRLRSAAELDWAARRLSGIQWRLREYAERPRAIDFRAFARTAWFGAFDLVDLRLVRDDLAIGGLAISEATPAQRARCEELAAARVRAIGWLRGLHQLYSRVDAPA